MSTGVSVAVIDTGELEELLGDWGTDDTGTSWGWDELDTDGGALSSDLSWDGMDSTDLVTPETSSDWDKLELGGNDGSLDGDLDFLGDLDSKTDVTVLISNGNDGLEAGSLSGLGLLLDGDDLHDLIGEGDLLLSGELLNDLGLLDWDGVGVDLLEGSDLSSLHQSSELGGWDPLVLSWSSWTTWAATGTTSSVAGTESSSSSLTVGWGGWLFSSLLWGWGSSSWGFFSHFVLYLIQYNLECLSPSQHTLTYPQLEIFS